MARFEGGLLDRECPHGLGQKSWCVLCNGRAAPKTRKPKKTAEATTKIVKPKCEVCQKKAEKFPMGHAFHRTYVPIYDPSTKAGRNPKRPIAHVQKRKIFDATHKDDAGRQVCDECCNDRCNRCKNWDPLAPNVAVVSAEALERVDVSMYTLSETSGLHQQIHGTSVSANIG